ncbi:site-specific DNA-methyltransferase [Prosthecochloris sp.]|uniref:DNA-methyltransferase n=1 Tax=Prosthecochloris sp. TaxID=290513 RepID=UPI0025D6B1D3|nr:site-specific DNA-methyltransferase [Prosthecochloris sp.]
MARSNDFLTALGLSNYTPAKLKALSEELNIPTKRLLYYDEENVLPLGKDLDTIQEKRNISEIELMIQMGHCDDRILAAIKSRPDIIVPLIEEKSAKKRNKSPKKVLETSYGELYKSDCIDLLQQVESDSVDLIFADPPFNLNKLYPSNIDDNLKKHQYLSWSKEWIKECVRVLKFGGSFFLWNLPKWNSSLAECLNTYLTFRHWVSVDIKYRLPIKGRLYPSHYSLLYYIKGDKPTTFHPDRVPMDVCPKCLTDLKDYGGYKHKMNPKGVNISDVWLDIPPVRHTKYKRREGANELSVKLVDRVIEMASNEGDVVLDPFGGSGTTYITAELKKRKWIGCEIGPAKDIINRFERIEEEKQILNDYRSKTNQLFTNEVKIKRKKAGLWTCDTFNNQSSSQQ